MKLSKTHSAHRLWSTGRLTVLLSGLALSGLACSKEETNAPSAEPAAQESSASAQSAKPTTQAASASAEPASDEGTAAQPAEPSAAPSASGEYGFDTPKPTETAAAKSAAPAESAKAPAAGEQADTKTQPTIRGAAVTGEGFRAHMQGPGSAAKGKASSVQVVLEAVAPFHCNDKYPYKFTPSPSAGVSYPQDVIKGMQVGEQRSTMNIPFTASESGKKTIAGELAFSVCTDDKCLIEKQQLSITVEVKDAS